MHPLQKWREKNEVSKLGLAQLIGTALDTAISPASITMWENGSEPRASVVAVLEKITEGKITAKSWL